MVAYFDNYYKVGTLLTILANIHRYGYKDNLNADTNIYMYSAMMAKPCECN